MHREQSNIFLCNNTPSIFKQLLNIILLDHATKAGFFVVIHNDITYKPQAKGLGTTLFHLFQKCWNKALDKMLII